MKQQTNYSDMATAFNQNATNQNSAADNRNISSVLSQIQDDGPARVHSGIETHVSSHINPPADARVQSHTASPKRDNLINLRSDETDKTSNEQTSEQTSESLNSKKKKPDFAAEIMSRKDGHARVMAQGAMDGGAIMKNRNKAAAVIALNKAKDAWLQLSLISFVVVFIMFFLFRIDARTNQLEVSLNSLDDEVLDTIDSYTSELSPKFRSLKRTLKEVKQDIEFIKDSTLIAAKPDKQVLSEPVQQSATNNDIGMMENEIMALKSELKIAKEKLKVVTDNKRNDENTDIKNQTTSAAITAVVTTGWVANIASFTNRNKANKALEPLYAVGLSPMVEQVKVNGNYIYRLIVDGFNSRTEAKTFVHRADHEFGLPGGWIRKS